MNKLGRIDKAPAEVTPYTILYAADMDAGDTLAAVSATVTFLSERALVSASPMTVGYAIYTNDPNLGPFSKVQLLGGALGDTWLVTVTATTSSGRVMVDSFVVKVK